MKQLNNYQTTNEKVLITLIKFAVTTTLKEQTRFIIKHCFYFKIRAMEDVVLSGRKL